MHKANKYKDKHQVIYTKSLYV